MEKSAWVDLHAGNMTVRADNWQLSLTIQILFSGDRRLPSLLVLGLRRRQFCRATILLLYSLVVAQFCFVKQHLCRTAFMFNSQSSRMSKKTINVKNYDQILRKILLILLKIMFTEAAPQSRILEQ